MGERATQDEATTEDLDAMRALLDASLASGALGFSSSWARTHNDAAGDMVPSRYATEDEIVALCSVVKDHPGHDARVHPQRRHVRGVRARPAHADVARREPSGQLERAVRRQGQRGDHRAQPGRVRLRDRARRTRHRVDGAVLAVAPHLFRQRLPARHHPGLGQADGAPARREEGDARVARRSRRAAPGRARNRRRDSTSPTGTSTSSTRPSPPRTSSGKARRSPRSPRRATSTGSTRSATSSWPTTS